MSARAINLVTLALYERLKAAVARSGVGGDVFVGPLDDENVGDATLILFLYRVTPNANLRNSEHTVLIGSPPPTTFRNSLPLDLYYLVTVGTSNSPSEDKPLTALGFAMQELQGNPTLTGAEIGHQAVQVSLEPLTTDESSRIWNLFPEANYRTSVAYLATPVWIDPALPEAEGSPVTDDQLRAGSRMLEGIQ